MRFSDAFSIAEVDSADWFDRHLLIDTRLFIDPFLMLDYGYGWDEAHEELIQHFVHCYRLVARATSKDSVSAKSARRLLTFPEPAEFGLGYTAGGTNGAGAGKYHAGRIADGIAVAISRGLIVPEHIEEIGLLNEGIGADLISDAIANVLKSRFIKYTQEIATKHGVPLDAHEVRHSSVSIEQVRWRDETVLLPTNPITAGPIILCPKGLLAKLPTLNSDDWFSDDLNEDLRGQMNSNVGRRVSKADIVELARKNAGRVRQWAKAQESRPDLRGYDFSDDELGVVQWDREPQWFAQKNPIQGLATVESEEDLKRFIKEMLEQFKHFIEEQRGWTLLYNSDGKEKPEEAAQLVFLGMAQHHMRLFGVEVDREVELGRGPVDFKISNGARLRHLIEIKKTHSGAFWNGLEAQLPSYLRSDQCANGWFVAIQYRSAQSSQRRMERLPAAVRACADMTGQNLRFVGVDARPKKSASNQRP